MEKSTLIRKIHMDCPLCNKYHEVEERERLTDIIIKDDQVSYNEKFYVCGNFDESENEFVTGSMMNENLLNARNAYRVKHGLLTSDDIIDIRNSYGLSQVDLSRLLGWGEATISRYESKAIQDEAYDTMLRLIKDNPLQALEFLEKNSSEFSRTKKEEIRLKILEKLDSYGKEYLTRQTLKGNYANYLEPSINNGFKILDIDKIEAAISYIAEGISNLFKVKLMKMLWYTDALSYQKTGHAMTGLVYTHSNMGALPIGHYSLMNLENVNVREEESYNYDYNAQHIYPLKNIDYEVLSVQDKSILDQVINKFKNFKSKDIIDYMHKEEAYIKTKPDEIIPFSLAEKIRAF